MKNKLTISTGLSSVLMVLIILIFTVFGILSYVTASADLKLSEKSVQAVSTYYSAESEFEELLYNTDNLLAQIKADSDNNQDYLNSALQQLEQSFDSMEYDDNTLIAAKDIEIDEKKYYHTEIQINDLDSDTAFTVKYAYVVSDIEWEEQDLNVWDGN